VTWLTPSSRRQTPCTTHSATSGDSPGSRIAPLQEDMVPGTLDRVVTSVATQLIGTARTADGVSELANNGNYLGV